MSVKEFCWRGVGNDIDDYYNLYASVYRIPRDETFFHIIKSGNFES